MKATGCLYPIVGIGPSRSDATASYAALNHSRVSAIWSSQTSMTGPAGGCERMGAPGQPLPIA